METGKKKDAILHYWWGHSENSAQEIGGWYVILGYKIKHMFKELKVNGLKIENKNFT